MNFAQLITNFSIFTTYFLQSSQMVKFYHFIIYLFNSNKTLFILIIN